MTDEDAGIEDADGGIGIYVMPTEEGLPARAMLMREPQVVEEPDGEELPEGVIVLGVQAAQATWTADVGCWTVEGVPLPKELSDAISAHAANLGVPGF